MKLTNRRTRNARSSQNRNTDPTVSTTGPVSRTGNRKQTPGTTETNRELGTDITGDDDTNDNFESLDTGDTEGNTEGNTEGDYGIGNNGTAATEVRLVEPEDFTSNADIEYQARLAYLLMRDRPLVFSHNDIITINPAPTDTITWLGRTTLLPYRDKSVTITHTPNSTDNPGGTITIDTTRTTSRTARRTIHDLALALADHIYATAHLAHLGATQDTLMTYTTIGAAMTTDYPRGHNHLTYGTTGELHHTLYANETFALHTPGDPDHFENIWHMKHQTIIQNSNHLVRRRWTAHPTDGTHDLLRTNPRRAELVKDIVTLRTSLDRYSWTNHEGITTAPVGWQYMDQLSTNNAYAA